MTPVGHLSATGQIKQTFLANWPSDAFLQIWSLDERFGTLRILRKNQKTTDRQSSVFSVKEAIEKAAIFCPDVIYFRPVDMEVLFDVTEGILVKLNKKLVLHIMDDWPERLRVNNSSKFRLLNTRLLNLIKKANVLLSISQYMSDEFNKRYGGVWHPISNGVALSEFPGKNWNLRPKVTNENPFIIRYMGGLADDMTFSSVKEIAIMVADLSVTYPVRFEIYTMDWYLKKAKKELSHLSGIYISTLVDESEYKRFLSESDVLVITYNFDKQTQIYTRLSMANKLPECFASGAVVLAYGPQNIATIDLLKNTGCAEVVTTNDNQLLKQSLIKLITDTAYCKALSIKARVFASQNMSKKQVQSKFFNFISMAAFNFPNANNVEPTISKVANTLQPETHNNLKNSTSSVLEDPLGNQPGNKNIYSHSLSKATNILLRASDNYLISVIIPVYNVEKYINECLQSLEQQNDCNFEVIAINDGSTDRSIMLAERFKERIKNFKIIHQKNKGLGGARNTGIDHASGEFIVFVDSDDIVTPDFLKVLRNEQISGNFDIVSGKFHKVTENGKSIDDIRNTELADDVELLYYQKILGLYESSIACARLIRKEVLLKHNIRFLKKTPHEDWFFTYKLFLLCPSFSNIDDTIYYWRQREGSLGKSISTEHIHVIPLLRADTGSFLKINNATNNDYDTAGRRILKILTVFRHRIRMSGDKLLPDFLTLLASISDDIDSDFGSFKKSVLFDTTIANSVQSILNEVEDYRKRNNRKTALDKKDSKHKLRISVITPSFNQEFYVQSMINSVADQTSAPFEHIILDGGSSDGSQAKLKSYENSCAFVTLHVGRDTSQTNAINLGFYESRGDILTWLNTDDKYYSKEVLNSVLDVFSKHPDVDVVYGRGNFIDNQGGFLREAFINKDPAKLKIKFSRSVGIIQPAVFFRRRVFEQIGPLDESLNYCFDYEYWIRMAHKGMKFYFLDLIVCEAVLHQDSKTIGQRKEQLLETIDVARKYYDFVSLEWLNKLADNMITGADGITTNTVKKSTDHTTKVKELFQEYNANQKAASSIWSLAPHEDIENTLNFLKSMRVEFKFYVATAFDSTYFQQGLTLIANLQKHAESKFAILVYNLGMSTDEINILSGLHNVYIIDPPLDEPGFTPQYLTFNTHGYRAYIPWHASRILPKGSNLIFIDPGIAAVRNFQDVINYISTQEILLIKFNDGSNNDNQLALSYTNDKCIKATQASSNELLAPLLNGNLFGYKTSGKFQKLFDKIYEHSKNDLFNNYGLEAKKNIPADPSLGELRKQVLNDHANYHTTEFQKIRQAFGFTDNYYFEPLLSILASRYHAPVLADNNICVLSSFVQENLGSIKKESPGEHIAEFELNDHFIPAETFFYKHSGHYLNHHGLKFNLKKKKRAIIMGNGPSLRGFDFNRLNGFDVFGMNAAYRYWDKINWYPQYFSCLDVVVGLSHAEEIKRLIENAHIYGIKQFLLLDNLIKELNLKRNEDRVISFELLRKGSEALSSNAVTTGSHTTAWAAYLGYEEIYLIGIDSNYVEVIEGAKHVKGAVLEMATTPGNNPNYFFDDYQQKGDVYHIPNPTRPVHLQGWREIAGRLRFTGSRILNANPLSKVDAFDFCHFSEIEQEKPIEIIPRERVVVNNFIINSLKEQNNHQGNRTVLFSGKTEGFNLKSFVNEAWHVYGLVSDETLIKNVGSRYELDIIGLDNSEWKSKFTSMIDLGQNVNVYNFVVTEEDESSKNLRITGKKSTNALKYINYLYIGPESGISLTKSTIRTYKPEVIEVYFDGKEGVLKNEDITSNSALLKSLGYTTYLLLRSNKQKEHEGFLFYHSCKELPSSIKQCSIYACATPLDIDQLLEQVANLDTHHLYLVQKYGFSFENVFKTEGVKEVDGRFKLSAPSGKNYIAFRYSGKVRPHDIITGSITFVANSPAKVKLMLCRDGSTPFEHGNKKITIEQGKHTLDIDHKFEFYHSGVRIQLGVEDGNPEVSEITTMISVRRDEKVMEVEGIYSRSGLSPQRQKVLTEQAASATKRLVERVQRSLYLYYRKAVELFFPESTKRRHYAGLLKENIVLFIIRIKNIFR